MFNIVEQKSQPGALLKAPGWPVFLLKILEEVMYVQTQMR
jgi:hypothetical protein